ncbi:hypothetical protein MOQ_004452 [Trypanosoma cruzi marinkellei]|uniref:Phosphoglycerate mutase protein n=1 Tax=Trypanosoma cruzi marinkellei TaxID=85056 RepID=K2MX87_TRYCR|nr:hypothetical protein MOQ_004452 [Trypanosoma cruzi marinkellei]
MSEKQVHITASGDVIRSDRPSHVEPSEQLIVVMRHGERRDGAVGSRPEVDPPLTENGIVQIAEVAKKLRALLGAKRARKLLLIVSPFMRTRQTAQELQKCAIGDLHHHIIDNTLCEVYGPVRIKSSTAPLLPDMIVKNGLGELPLWGETIEMASQRYVDCFFRNCHSYPDKNLLLVTHGDAISAIMAAFFPLRTVYETEFLSFIVFQRDSKSVSRSDLDSCQLITSSGVQWLVEGPETSLAEMNTLEADGVSGSGLLVRNFEPPPNTGMCGYGCVHFNDGEIDGEWMTLNAPHEANRHELASVSLIFRCILIVSQWATIYLWSNKGDAVIYMIMVIAVELILALLHFNNLSRLRLGASLSRLELFHRLTRNQLAFVFCGLGSTFQRCTFSLCISLLKALGIFVLCMAAALFAGLFQKSGFLSMRHSYAEIFESVVNSSVFALFLLIDTYRRLNELEH